MVLQCMVPIISHIVAINLLANSGPLSVVRHRGRPWCFQTMSTISCTCFHKVGVQPEFELSQSYPM